MAAFSYAVWQPLKHQASSRELAFFHTCLFAGSESTERRQASIMSLLANARSARGPHAILSHVLTRMPTTKNRDASILPSYVRQPTARTSPPSPTTYAPPGI